LDWVVDWVNCAVELAADWGHGAEGPALVAVVSADATGDVMLVHDAADPCGDEMDDDEQWGRGCNRTDGTGDGDRMPINLSQRPVTSGTMDGGIHMQQRRRLQ
jgi:hypothetical protein